MYMDARTLPSVLRVILLHWTLISLNYNVGWEPMPGLPSGGGAACADPCRRLVGTTRIAPAYYRVPLKVPSHTFKVHVKGDNIPLVSPRRFKARCSPHLDAKICDMLYAAMAYSSYGARVAYVYHGL